MTNRDKINALSNKELAKILNRLDCSFCIFKEVSHCSGTCLEGVEQWLNTEVEENEQNKQG